MPLLLLSLLGLAYQVYSVNELLGVNVAAVWAIAGLAGILVLYGIVGALIEIEYNARRHVILLKKQLDNLKP